MEANPRPISLSIRTKTIRQRIVATEIMTSNSGIPLRNIALVTGASSGFGRATSEVLSENGYKVFGTSRNPGRVIDTPKNIEMLELDVNSDDSVKSCVGSLLEKTKGQLDVLINNAGIVTLGAIEEMSMEETKMQLETNLFGAVRMIRAVLPTMRSHKSGRIINIGSLAGHIAVPFQGMYATSKFALEGFTEQLRQETRNLGIKVSIVEPGFFRTNILKSAQLASQRIEDYGEERSRAIAALGEFEQKGADPILVARTILKILGEKRPKLHYAVGKEKSGLLFKRILPQTIFEGQVRRIFKLDEKKPKS